LTLRRALLVSYYFPPRYSVGGKRPHGFATHLPDHGWRVTVLTSAAPPGERVDPSFSCAAPRGCEIYRDVLSPEEQARMPPRALGSDGTLAAPTEAWQRVQDRRGWARVRAELRIVPVIGPDARLVPSIARRIARLASRAAAEVVFATAPPWEVAVAAAAAARIARLPLVLDFRDPWSYGPLMARRPAWARAASALVEGAVLRSAAALTVTSEAIRDDYARRAPWARVVCVRSGFDDPGPIPQRREGPLTLVHFGNCYGERSLAPFLRALALVARRRALPPGSLRILNLGRVARGDLDLAADLGVAPMFEHRTVLPYAEGLALVAGADLALLPSFGAEPWFIPGKLYDYLRVQAPILAASASPEIERLLAATRLGWAHPAGDTEALAGRIEHAIAARGSGGRLVEPDLEALAALSTRATAGQLARLLEDVAPRSGAP
jgi:hypothetical protein